MSWQWPGGPGSVEPDREGLRDLRGRLELYPIRLPKVRRDVAVQAVLWGVAHGLALGPDRFWAPTVSRASSTDTDTDTPHPCGWRVPAGRSLALHAELASQLAAPH